MTVFARLIQEGVVDAADASLLSHLVREGKSILVTGKTGAGKTTLLQALIGEVPEYHRLVIAEHLTELTGPTSAVYLEVSRAEAENALTAIASLRPDTVVLGDIDVFAGAPQKPAGVQFLSSAHYFHEETIPDLLQAFDAVIHVKRERFEAPQIHSIYRREFR